MSETQRKSDEQIASEHRAQGDLESIIRLRAFQPFTRYFMQRIKEKKLAQQAKVLDPSTPDDELAQEKNLLRVWNEVESLIDNDEAGCRSILALPSDELPQP